MLNEKVMESNREAIRETASEDEVKSKANPGLN
jgi:hypothetical protein